MKVWGLLALLLFCQSTLAEESSTLEVTQVELKSDVLKTESLSQKWKFTLESEFYANQGDQEDKGAESRVTSYHWATAKYNYDATTALKAVPTFELNAVRSQQDRAKNVQDEVYNGKTFDGARMADPYVAYVKNAGKIWGSDTMSTEVRYYLPVGEVSREVESVGILRLDYLLPWTVGKWTFTYYLNPRLNMESHAIDNRPTNVSFREHGVVSYNFSDTFSVYSLVGHRWLLKEQNFLRNEESTYVFEWGVTKAFTKNVAVTLYLDNLYKDEEQINLFASNKNDFTLYTNLSF